jgi:hypothetical protein
MFLVSFFSHLPLKLLHTLMISPTVLVGHCPWGGDKDYHIGSSFRKFYLIRIDFTLGEPASLVKVFRLFRLERSFLVFRVWTESYRCPITKKKKKRVHKTSASHITLLLL